MHCNVIWLSLKPCSPTTSSRGMHFSSSRERFNTAENCMGCIFHHQLGCCKCPSRAWGVEEFPLLVKNQCSGTFQGCLLIYNSWGTEALKNLPANWWRTASCLKCFHLNQSFYSPLNYPLGVPFDRGSHILFKEKMPVNEWADFKKLMACRPPICPWVPGKTL